MNINDWQIRRLICASICPKEQRIVIRMVVGLWVGGCGENRLSVSMGWWGNKLPLAEGLGSRKN